MLLPCKIPTLRHLKVRLVTIFSPDLDKCDKLSQENPINKFKKKTTKWYPHCLYVYRLHSALESQAPIVYCWLTVLEQSMLVLGHISSTSMHLCFPCLDKVQKMQFNLILQLLDITERLKNCEKYLCGVLLYNLKSFSRWLKNIFNDEFT